LLIWFCERTGRTCCSWWSVNNSLSNFLAVFRLRSNLWFWDTSTCSVFIDEKHCVPSSKAQKRYNFTSIVSVVLFDCWQTRKTLKKVILQNVDSHVAHFLFCSL